MRGIYNKRAKLIYNLLNTAQCDLNLSEMITKLFQTDPSFTEEAVCNCTQSNCSTWLAFPLAVINHQIFSDDFLNLERAITENLAAKLKCRRCNNEVECKREFGSHIFIEVIKIM